MPRNHVFLVLMLFAFLCAFILPPRITDPPRSELAGLFSPISRPARAIAGALHRRFHPDTPIDVASPTSPRPAQTLLEENAQLREALGSLTIRYQKMAELNDARQLRADILPLCRAVAVAGVDPSGLREALLIGSSSLAGLHVDDPVLYAPQCLAGRVVRAGVSGAEVRLITDPGFNETARIVQYVPNGSGGVRATPIESLQPLVQGIGHGAMAIRSTVSMADVASLKISVNDVLELDDPEWRPDIQGVWIGRITDIRPQPDAPLFADIRVEPIADLLRLREVMVMVGGQK